jgi:DNA-binding LytR/AlgR family response regulator
MKKHTCIIIDDEQYSIEWLSKYVEALPNLVLLKSYTDPLEALFELSDDIPVDLVLLDIKMPLISGIDLSRKIRTKTHKLVFSTAYKRYGYEAYEAEADGYLLKPYTLSKFASTIDKLFSKPILHQPIPLPDDYFFAKNVDDNFKLVKIRYIDIVAVESKQNYIMIHTERNKILTHMTLTEISRSLQKFPLFAQFQRSFIISKHHIDYVYGNTLKMTNGLEITVGEFYRKDFSAFLSEKLIKGKTS